MLLFAALACVEPGPVGAQVVQSERGTVSQTIDGTTISIDYGRPRMKGRGEELTDVAWVGDHRWTPGADWATTITANRDFDLNGHRVGAGTWTVFIDLEPDAWTLLLDPADSVYHTEPPPDRDGQIRFEVEPREGPFIETLMFWIPETRMSGFDLLLSWGRTEIPFEVRVDPTFETTVDREAGEELLGEYTFMWVGEPDTAVPFRVFRSGEHLDVETTDVDTGEPFHGRFLPRGEDFFWLGQVRDGHVFDIEVDILYEVVRDDGGEVVGLDARWADDSVIATVR